MPPTQAASSSNYLLSKQVPAHTDELDVDVLFNHIPHPHMGLKDSVSSS